MIQYAEKGAGLHERIRVAGHWLRQENGAWVSSNDAAVQAIIDAYTLDDARAAVKVEIDRLAKDKQDRFVSALIYSAGEMSTWPLKLDQAKAFLASGDPADAPLLALETTPSRTLADVAQRVIDNGAAYSDVSGGCARARSIHKDALAALTTFEEVLAYDYSTGWPV